MDAGIPLKSAFSAVCLAVFPNGQVFVDPTSQEEAQAESLHTFVFDTACEGAYAIHSLGPFGAQTVRRSYFLPHTK
jgi:exosome complex component RRP46